MAPPAKVNAELLAKARKMKHDGASLRDIEQATGISKARWSTLLADGAKLPKERVAPAPTTPSQSGPEVASPAPSQAPALPQGGTVSGKPDLLELLRRIGRARNARAWAEVEEGLVVAARGEAELAAWLVRPPEVLDVKVDELDALQRAVDRGVEIMERADNGGPALRALREVASLGKSLAAVKARRPHEPKPNEVHEAVRGEMDTCVEHLLRHTREAAAKLERDRRALFDGVDVGPSARAEIERRVGAMLGAES